MRSSNDGSIEPMGSQKDEDLTGNQSREIKELINSSMTLERLFVVLIPQNTHGKPVYSRRVSFWFKGSPYIRVLRTRNGWEPSNVEIRQHLESWEHKVLSFLSMLISTIWLDMEVLKVPIFLMRNVDWKTITRKLLHLLTGRFPT